MMISLRHFFRLTLLLSFVFAAACEPLTGSALDGGGQRDAPPLGDDPHQNRPIQVGLLSGDGVWEEGRLALQQQIEAAGFVSVDMDGAAIRQGALYEVKALVVGGGWAWDQWQALGPAGISKIRHFVMAGGSYLGICAGAYLASDDVIWEDEWLAYPLNLFDGIASGPLADFPWPEAGRVQVDVLDSWDPWQAEGSLTVYYQGGAVFAPRDAQTVTPLLRFKGIDTGSTGDIAALRFDFGAGHVLLSAVHPEMGVEELDAGVMDAGELEAGAAEAGEAQTGPAQLLQSWLRWLAGPPPSI